MADALLTHAFVSPYLDGPDATKLQPSAWNASLLLSAGADGDLLVRDSVSATGGTWLSPASLLAAVTPASLGLGNVENTALSTWAGSASLTTVGTLAGLTFTGQSLAPNGTALLPAYSFASEPTLGFWRPAANTVNLVGGNLSVTGGIMSIAAAGTYSWVGRSRLAAPVDGTVTITNAAATANSGTLNVGAYQVGGVAGASKAAGPVTSITVVNGIVTACT